MVHGPVTPYLARYVGMGLPAAPARSLCIDHPQALPSPRLSTHPKTPSDTPSPLPRTENTRLPLVWLNVWFLTAYAAIAITAAVWYGLTVGITWREVLACLVIWAMTGLGITAGYHRLFSHCSYKAHAVVRFFYAVLGAAAIQNNAIAWCSDHRYHHAETDTDGDPYDATRGFWYSHMGWIFVKGLRNNEYANVADLRADPILAWQQRNYFAILAVTNVLLVTIAGLLLGNWLGMIIIAGLLRIVLVQHATFLINSAAHCWGTQPWSNSTTSRDNWFLSLFTLGEGYHNYHHAFQADYRNGPRWYNWDPTKWLIWGMGSIGLATGLRRTPAEVVLDTRFQESSRSLTDRLDAWGVHKAEEWSELIQEKKSHLLDRRDELIHSLKEEKAVLRDRLLTTQATLELNLQELKAMRASLRERMRSVSSESSDEWRLVVKREIKHLRHSIRQAQRTAKAHYRGWERLAREYAASLPAPVPVTA